MSNPTVARSLVQGLPGTRHATGDLFALRPLFRPLLSDKDANDVQDD
jgi:hypothetical protein